MPTELIVFTLEQSLTISCCVISTSYFYFVPDYYTNIQIKEIKYHEKQVSTYFRATYSTQNDS